MGSVSERVAAWERKSNPATTAELRAQLEGLLNAQRARQLASEGWSCAEIAAELSMPVVKVWGALRP